MDANRQVLTATAILQDPDVSSLHLHRLNRAVNGLRNTRPEFSASAPLPLGQRFALAAPVALAIAGSFFVPQAVREFALSLLALPFLFVVLTRVAALWLIAGRAETSVASSEMPERDWPRYSLFVPLYKEAEVAPGLVHSLAALDYPRDRLEIFFITEAGDSETRNALSNLPGYMYVLTVPDGTPRTKPRALNFALEFANGDYAGIFDAEDVPEPQQLKKAILAFEAGGPEVACVQARLNIYNPGSNFLTRQFTLEYAALFDCMLPAFDRLGLPLPLGGTSNHFDRRMLDAAGAWDPFNVTEDADLGVRLARLGKRTAMLDSTTWEEAPETFSAWYGQRSRWIKGWMQTYLVHMRSPARALRELGPWAFFGFNVIFGGLILSALVHPLFYLVFLMRTYDGAAVASASGSFETGLWWFCCFNLVAGYTSSIALAAIAAARRGGRLLVRSALGLPIYWLLISLAAYRALAELALRPHHWAKTVHRGDGRDGISMAIGGGHAREASKLSNL